MAFPAIFSALSGIMGSMGQMKAPAMNAMKGAMQSTQKVPPSKFEKMGEMMGNIQGMAGQFEGLLKAIPIFAEGLKVIQELFKPLNFLVTVFGAGLKIGLLPAFQKLYEMLLNPETMKKIMDLGMKIGELLGTSFMKLLEILDVFLQKGIIDDINEIMVSFTEAMVGFVDELIASGIVESFMKLGTELLKLFVDVINVLVDSGALMDLIDMAVLITGVILEISRVILPIMIVSLIPAIKLFAESLDLLNTTGALPALSKAIDKLMPIINMVTDAIIWFTDKIGDLFDMIKMPKGAGGGGGGGGLGWGGQLPKIKFPWMQGGGTVMGTGIATVHKGELVLNDAMMESFTRGLGAVVASISNLPNGRTFNTTVNATVMNTETARSVAREIDKRNYLVS